MKCLKQPRIKFSRQNLQTILRESFLLMLKLIKESKISEEMRK
jgi:hypothetical protein